MERNITMSQKMDLPTGPICPRYHPLLYHFCFELDVVLGFLTFGSSVTESETGPEPRAACISLHSSSAASHSVLLSLLEASQDPSKL